jgi:hypothetical protein
MPRSNILEDQNLNYNIYFTNLTIWNHKTHNTLNQQINLHGAFKNNIFTQCKCEIKLCIASCIHVYGCLLLVCLLCEFFCLDCEEGLCNCCACSGCSGCDQGKWYSSSHFDLNALEFSILCMILFSKWFCNARIPSSE